MVFLRLCRMFVDVCSVGSEAALSKKGRRRVPSSRSAGGSGSKRSNGRQAKPHRKLAKNGSPGRNAKSPQFDDLVGRGADLWNDDEFERFQVWLQESRRRGE